jgi:hypothetical protein
MLLIGTVESDRDKAIIALFVEVACGYRNWPISGSIISTGRAGV